MNSVNILKRDSSLPKNLSTWLTQMNEIRERLLNIIEELDEEALDYTPSERKIETIGTLLLHIAAVELGWIFEDIYKEEIDYDEWKYAFPLRTSVNLPQLTGKGKNYYLNLLQNVRKSIIERLQDEKNLSRIIQADGQKYSIEWILFHLVEHEALHIGQINLLNRLYKIERNNLLKL
ncbi:MAG: DinB family protein [Candidatus Thorarchaeota archaeon]